MSIGFPERVNEKRLEKLARWGCYGVSIDRGHAVIVRYDTPVAPGGMTFTEAKRKAIRYYQKRKNPSSKEVARLRAMKKADLGILVTL